MLPSHDIVRVPGANVSQATDAGDLAPLTIALCDGSQFTFTRLVDPRTSADVQAVPRVARDPSTQSSARISENVSRSASIASRTKGAPT